MNEDNVETTDSWSYGKILKYVLLPKPKGSPKAGKKEIALRLVLATSIGAFATQSLWLGKSLPECGQTETTSLVGKIINDMPEAKSANTQYISLKNITEQGYNKEQEIRLCKATLVTTIGEDDIQYSVKWDNKKAGTFAVEARLVNQASLVEQAAEQAASTSNDGEDWESEPVFEPATEGGNLTTAEQAAADSEPNEGIYATESPAPTVEYVPLNVSDRGVSDVFTLWRPDESKGQSGGNALNYQSRAGAMNVMESVVSEPDLTGYIKVEKAYSFGNQYILVVSTGENGNSCPATTYAFTFNAKTESVTGKSEIDGCSETVESLAVGNKLTVKKEGKPSVFYNGEVLNKARN